MMIKVKLLSINYLSVRDYCSQYYNLGPISKPLLLVRLRPSLAPGWFCFAYMLGLYTEPEAKAESRGFKKFLSCETASSLRVT